MSEGETLQPHKLPPGGGARALAEGAMLTAVALILAVISLYVPILNIIAPFLFPAPLALLVLRQGIKYGFVGALSVFLLSAMLLGLPQAIYLFILYGFLGLFFGWCFRTGKKAVFTLVGGVLISCASIMLLLLFPHYILGVSADQFREMLSATLREYTLMIEQQGASSLLGGMSIDEYVEYVLSFLPVMMFIMAIGLTFACYALLGRLLRRLGYNITKLPPFREWRLDWRLLWLLIVSLFASSLGERLHYVVLAQIANNLLSAMQIIFLIYGSTLLIWLFWRFKVGVFLRVLALLFIIQLFSGIILIVAGVFDPLFDFRGRLDKYLKKRENRII